VAATPWRPALLAVAKGRRSRERVLAMLAPQVDPAIAFGSQSNEFAGNYMVSIVTAALGRKPF